MLVTVERYQVITGDTDTPSTAVEERIADATALLEDELARPLEEAERTERMYPLAGVFYPLATPITDAGDWAVDGATLRYGVFGGVPDWLSGTDFVEVTYTGGYVERSENPDEPNRLPAHVERDLAWAAYALGRPQPALASVPAGANAASVGDVSLSSSSAGGLSAASVGVAWSKATLRLRRRRL